MKFSVSLRGNLFHGRDSMTPEVLALISKVEHIDFEQNPLTELPYGLFLLPVHRESTARQILSTLLQLPVWKTEPCTPYMWHFHLRNRFGVPANYSFCCDVVKLHGTARTRGNMERYTHDEEQSRPLSVPVRARHGFSSNLPVTTESPAIVVRL